MGGRSSRPTTLGGHDGIWSWFEILGGAAVYDRFEPLEPIVQGEKAAELIHATGYVKATGRRFESEVACIWTIWDGKVIRVRRFYDTYAYVSALHRM